MEEIALRPRRWNSGLALVAAALTGAGMRPERKSPLSALRTWMLLGLSLVAVCRAFSDEPKGESPCWRVLLDVQMLAVSPKDAFLILPKLRDIGTVDAACRELQEWTAQGQAVLLAWPVIQTSDLKLGSSATVGELVYPTYEIRVASPPQSFSVLPGPAPMQVAAVQDAEPRVPWRWRMRIPFGYETRNVGATWEAGGRVEPNGKYVELSASPKLVELLTFHENLGPPPANGMQGVTVQPEFSIANATTDLIIPNGKRRLLGAVMQEKPENRVVLFILHAVVHRAGSRSATP